MPEEEKEVMADLPISALPPTVTPTATDELAQEQVGTTKKINLQQVADFVGGNITTLIDKQVVYGGPTGEIAQSASMTFDDVNLFFQFGSAHVITTAQNSALIGGTENEVLGPNSVILGGDFCLIDAGSSSSAVIASANGITNGDNAAVIASSFSSANGNFSVGIASATSPVSGDFSAAIASNAATITGTRSASLAAESIFIEADTSFASGVAIDIFPGATTSIALGEEIQVLATATNSFTWNDGQSVFIITEPNSYNLKSSGNSQFETTATGTLKVGSVAVGDYIEVTNTQVNRVGNFVRRKLLTIAEYDDGGAGSAGISRPYDGITVLTFDSAIEERVNLVDTVLPYDFDPSVNIEVDLLWTPSTVAGGEVEWNIWYSFLTPDGTNALNGNNTLLFENIIVPTNAEQPLKQVFTLNTALALPGDELFIGLFRLGNLDTYPDDIWVTSCRAYYFSNQL